MSAPETSATGTADRVHEVLVVGSGFAGLGQLLALRRAGVTDVVLLEKSEALGGTWRDNTYPGCACDIPSHMYSFSFERPNPDWSRSYSPQPEIREYLERVADAEDLRRHVRFGQEMTGATWDEQSRTWTVHTARRTELARPLPRPRRRGPAPAEDARPARGRLVRRALLPLRAVGPRRRPAREEGRGHRHRGQRHPVRPADRRRRGGGAALPAHPGLGPAQERQAAPGGPPALLRPPPARPPGVPRR